MDLLSSLSSRGQPNWLQATVSTILQNLIQTKVFKELVLKKNYKRDRGFFFKYLAIIYLGEGGR